MCTGIVIVVVMCTGIVIVVMMCTGIDIFVNFSWVVTRWQYSFTYK
jgi:hypothetical protein